MIVKVAVLWTVVEVTGPFQTLLLTYQTTQSHISQCVSVMSLSRPS